MDEVIEMVIVEPGLEDWWPTATAPR
eukprot:COSAG06_NODE_30032_length_546_cov_0.561521_2_plen_25_part_01